MNGGAKLAVGILSIFGSMVMFYFAFHPGGVSGVSNPSDALQWIRTQFQATATAGGTGNASGTPSG